MFKDTENIPAKGPQSAPPPITDQSIAFQAQLRLLARLVRLVANSFRCPPETEYLAQRLDKKAANDRKVL